MSLTLTLTLTLSLALALTLAWVARLYGTRARCMRDRMVDEYSAR